MKAGGQNREGLKRYEIRVWLRDGMSHGRENFACGLSALQQMGLEGPGWAGRHRRHILRYRIDTASVFFKFSSFF